MTETTETALQKPTAALPLRTPVTNTIAVLDTGLFEQMWRVAKAMAAASLIPDHLKVNGQGGLDRERTAANCFLVVNQAVRWDMCPFSLMAGSYVVGGKVSYEGKVIAAVINARAGLKGRLGFDYSGSGQARTITISGTFADDPNPRSLTGSVKEWQTKNPMWTKGGVATDQKLAYTGAIWWARRHAPELVLGVILEGEELLAGSGSTIDVTPAEPALLDTAPVAPPNDRKLEDAVAAVASGGLLSAADRKWWEDAVTKAGKMDAAINDPEIGIPEDWMRSTVPRLERLIA
jgi:hypothetical protein